MIKVYMVSLIISEMIGKKYLRVEDLLPDEEIRLVPLKIVLSDIRNATLFETQQTALLAMSAFAESRKSLSSWYTFAIEEKYIVNDEQAKNRICRI